MAAYREQLRDTPNDIPPNSRLFVIAGRGIKEDEYRECFSKYGQVEDIWIVKDRRTNEEKGITYVKFSRASEAALAMEEVNGRTIGSHPKPVKVIIASNRKDGNVRDPREEEKLVRLFVVCPKKFSEDDLKQEFKQYGDIEYTQVVRDRSSGENKGFGYVKFHRPYHAAVALESCDPSFKPKFAEPKTRKSDREREERDDYDFRYDRHERDSRSGFGGMQSSKRMFPDTSVYDDYPMMDDRRAPQYGLGHMPMVAHQMPAPVQSGGMGPAEMLQQYPNSGCQRLHITAPLGMTQSYLSRLFNLIPGLEYCDLNEQTGVAYARYQTSQCAAYAHDKLDGFEYPIGSRLIVRYADSQPPPDLASSSMSGYGSMGGQSTSPMSAGGGTLQRAASLLERAGIDPGEVLACGVERVRYCNLVLPIPQPLRSEGTECKVRLFVVCQPLPIPEKILRDAFCRFGDLIDVFLLSGRNYGYAKYADKSAAEKAMSTLHGQTLAGNRLKVLEADPPKEDHRRDDNHRDEHHREEQTPNKKQRT
ncbi:RNA-binding protein 45-like [Liolophura sinensis]|uniref:RNA-binding protein 45-like n=1 Tax=Liolophura sinensis TaxID=3198878 RepID=UPI0031594440